MKKARFTKTSDVRLRQAAGEDESLILELERSTIRKAAESTFGRWTPRPGMGDRFPQCSWIIQYKNDDVGCITIHEERGLILIDQFYIVRTCQNIGIGTVVLVEIINKASIGMRNIQVNIFNRGEDVRRFFEIAGFVIKARSQNILTLEYVHQRESPTWVN